MAELEFELRCHDLPSQSLSLGGFHEKDNRPFLPPREAYSLLGEQKSQVHLLGAAAACRGEQGGPNGACGGNKQTLIK